MLRVYNYDRPSTHTLIINSVTAKALSLALKFMHFPVTFTLYN